MKTDATVLPHDLIEAYRGTDYVTTSTPVGQIVLRPGVINDMIPSLLDGALEVHAPQCGVAFITAFNPFSIRLPASMNTSRHDDLREVLRSGGWPFFEGDGVGLDHQEWEPEKSFLVVGISRHTAKDIGTLFQQNAIIYSEAGAPVELLLLR